MYQGRHQNMYYANVNDLFDGRNITQNITKDVPTKSMSTETFPTKCTSTNFYILLGFLLTTATLLIAVSIYCSLIKYQAKQKHLLPYHNTSKLKEIDMNYIL